MRGRRPGLRAIGLSLLIHLGIAAPVVVFARSPEPMQFETIRINLVSPPPAQVEDAQPAPAEVAPQPEPDPPQPEPEPEARVEREPPPKPAEQKREERAETEKPPETPRQTTTPSQTRPAEDAATGGEGLNIRTEGREFPYPQYLENVIIQVNRFFRWSGDDRPKALVYFEILGDGSVRNIRVVRPSGNRRFDFAVQGAVETAGTRGAFGPLPEGYAAPTLPVQLEVEPPR